MTWSRTIAQIVNEITRSDAGNQAGAPNSSRIAYTSSRINASATAR